MERVLQLCRFVCFVFINVALVNSQQCSDFVEIAEGDYDMTYSDITAGDGGARPLGFTKDTLVYQGSDTPCYKVTGVAGQNVEVKFETIPSMRLCVKDKNSDYDICAEGRFSDCMTLNQASAELEFYCDVADGCAEGDVNFWVRLTKGPLPADDTEGMWCHELQDHYPESLRPLPPNFTPKPPPEGPTGGATGLTATARGLTAAIVALLYVIVHY